MPLRLLDNKRKEIGDAASKLRNGLDKLIDTRQKVEAMTVDLEETKGQLAIFQKQCEEYLVVIVQQKRDAEEQEKSVAARSEKIAVEEARCQVRELVAVPLSPPPLGNIDGLQAAGVKSTISINLLVCTNSHPWG